MLALALLAFAHSSAAQSQREVEVVEPSPPSDAPRANAVTRPAPGPTPSSLPFCERHATPSPCIQPPDAYRHDGFYFRAGAHIGYLTIFGNGGAGHASVSALGVTSWTAIGGTPARGLVVSGVFELTVANGPLRGYPGEPDVDVTSAGLGALVDWFPNPEDGWHLAGAAGFGDLTVGSNPWSGGVVFGSVTGGYDFWIGPEWSFGLGAFATITNSASMRDSNGQDTGYRFMLFAAGISYGMLFH